MYKTLEYLDNPNIVAVAVGFNDDGRAYVSAVEGNCEAVSEVLRRLSIIPAKEIKA